MLLHHARRAARWADDGSLVPLAEQDRSRWDTALVAEGVDILQAALARDRLASTRPRPRSPRSTATPPSTEETDWAQVLEWYDELLRLTDSPVVALNRAVAVGEADGAARRAARARDVPVSVPRRTAAAAWLHERAGDLAVGPDALRRRRGDRPPRRPSGTT